MNVGESVQNIKLYMDFVMMKNQLVAELNKDNCVVQEYHSNGILKSQHTYVNGELDGMSIERYKNGNIKALGYWKQGEMFGVNRMYYPNSEVAVEYNAS